MHLSTPLSFWIAFHALMFAALWFDLVRHQNKKAMTLKEAIWWSIFWTIVAFAFNGVVAIWRGSEAGFAFLTGYILERSLSVDNLFVFIVLFERFAIPPERQHRVLFWGILGALIMRAGMIAAGIALIHAFEQALYFFGAILLWSGWKMLQEEEVPEDGDTPIIKTLKRYIPVADDPQRENFFKKKDGKWIATPLFLVLVAIEITDLVFALDSVPAVLAITTDPFLVYTSNVFAILGMRALYFALAGAMRSLSGLRYGLAAILVFIGAKMMLHGFFHISTALSLVVIAVILAISALGPWLWTKVKKSA